jgi:hypothetical protein
MLKNANNIRKTLLGLTNPNIKEACQCFDGLRTSVVWEASYTKVEGEEPDSPLKINR